MRKPSANLRLLDAWALLSWLKGTPRASEKVQRLLEGAEAGRWVLAMSMINVGEVFYILAKTVGLPDAESFLVDMRRMPVTSIPVAKRLVLEAARLKARWAISYADAFAAATAVRENATLVTGDPEFEPLGRSGVLDIEWIGS